MLRLENWRRAADDRQTGGAASPLSGTFREGIDVQPGAPAICPCAWQMQTVAKTPFDTSISPGGPQAVRKDRFRPGTVNRDCELKFGARPQFRFGLRNTHDMRCWVRGERSRTVLFSSGR